MGSIGWNPPSDEDGMKRLLQTMCGCEPVDDPVYPVMSASVIRFEESEKRKNFKSQPPNEGITLMKGDFDEGENGS
jgi:hypothetical protein